MIYLDHAATSPMSKQVVEAMWPYLTQYFGNASSQHEFGKLAARSLEAARRQVASSFGCAPSQVIFTSGATEANNMAIKGMATSNPFGKHIVTTAIEHESVLETCKFLERAYDFKISYVPVDYFGSVDLKALAESVNAATTLCTVQYANNEVGTIQQISRIAEICAEHSVTFRVDAVQAAGVLPLNIPADLISISAHKFGGPKGIGVLVNKGEHIEPLLHGGGQESGARSGTSNVAGAIGLAAALKIAEEQAPTVTRQMTDLRDHLIDRIRATVPQAILLGDRLLRLPQNAAFAFRGVSGEAVLLELESMGIACSSGSACAAGHDEPSHVLMAMGIEEDLARTAVRFTLGATTTRDDIDAVLAAVPRALANLS